MNQSYNSRVMEHTLKHPLRAFRDANGHLSQEAAAAIVGISQAMWSLLESGKKHASPRVAKRIERLIGVPADSLMDLDDNEVDAIGVGAPRKTL